MADKPCGNVPGRPKAISENPIYIKRVLELDAHGFLPNGIASHMSREGLYIERRCVKKILVLNGCL
jgi:hypothetical protein